MIGREVLSSIKRKIRIDGQDWSISSNTTDSPVATKSKKIIIVFLALELLHS